MTSANPDVRTVSCPGCGTHYDFPAAMAGRRGRCAKCGTTFAVPAAAAAPQQVPPAPPKPQPKAKKRAAVEPAYIGFECRVCQTRMYGGLVDVGKKMKCPDCGARTEVPPPPPPKKPNMPAALEGEQYELWDANEQPLPSELIANQPKYIAVTCRTCSTLMYAGENQIGQTIICPDCNTKHVVTQPARPKSKHSVLARDGETPTLDPAAHPGERPLYVPPPATKMDYEERQDAEWQRAVEKSRRTGKPMEIDSRGRPILPRWPLITGIVPFLFSRSVPIRWLALSVGFFGAVSILLYGLEQAMAGGVAAISGMCFFVIGCVLTMLCAAAASSTLVAIITQSSEGNREVEYWPGIYDWFGDLLLVGIAGLVSAVPGWAIGKIPSLVPSEEYRVLLAVGGTLIFLPIVLMSQLDINSPWGVLSVRVLGSIARCPFSWLLFYLEVGLLAAACGAASFFVAGGNPNDAVWLAPLYIVAAFLFARLLGRLGWRLAEVLPARPTEA